MTYKVERLEFFFLDQIWPTEKWRMKSFREFKIRSLDFIVPLSRQLIENSS